MNYSTNLYNKSLQNSMILDLYVGQCDVGVLCTITSANKRCSSNVELMLGHRLRRWPNIDPTLDKGLVFAGTPSMDDILI